MHISLNSSFSSIQWAEKHRYRDCCNYDKFPNAPRLIISSNFLFLVIERRRRMRKATERGSVKFHARRHSMKTLKLYVYILDFRTRATSTRVAQQSWVRVARKNSGNGIAKRNIPVDFTSAISLRGLNKNISPRSRARQHGEPQSEMFARVSALPPWPPSPSLATPVPIGTQTRA